MDNCLGVYSGKGAWPAFRLDRCHWRLNPVLRKNGSANWQERALEKEHGKLIWSFEINTPDTKDITDVNLDAVTGEVANIEHEKAE